MIRTGQACAILVVVLATLCAGCGAGGDVSVQSPSAASLPGVAPSAPEAGVSPTEEPLGVIEDTRIVFYRTELSVINDSGVLLNLVASDGGVGIRFYKDFGFGGEQHTNPWHMGWIEGTPGYQGLAILRDWLFTAALWDEDGRLLVGRLDPHPPANAPAEARLHVRGTLDEPQVIVEAPMDQASSIFEVASRDGTEDGIASLPRLAVDGSGTTIIGSAAEPRGIVIHDAVTGVPYLITVSDGQLNLAPYEGE